MARTLAQIDQEHSRLQSMLNSTPANKTAARNEIAGNMRKLQAERSAITSGSVKKEESSPMVMYMVVGAVVVIALSFGVAFFMGSKV